MADTALRARLIEAFALIYNDLGPDLGWVERTPDDDEFVDVLRDQIGNDRVHEDDLAAFRAMPRDEARALILRVGP